MVEFRPLESLLIYQYLYKRKFILITVHKPLVAIFNLGKHLPLMTSNRLQRWVIIFMVNIFDTRYCTTAAHGNTDALSRLPVGMDLHFEKEVETCNTILKWTLPIADTIRKPLSHDEFFRKIMQLVTVELRPS